MAGWRATGRLAALCLGLVAAVGLAGPVGAQTASAGQTLGGTVDDATGPADGVVVDLFAVGGPGGSQTWLGDTVTGSGPGGPGTYRFDVEPGCYRIVVIAPPGRVFTSGSPWAERGGCLAADSSLPDLDATLRPVGASTLSGTVTLDGAPAPFVGVDLHRAGADGSRSTWLASTTTGADADAGRFSFAVPAGCYVVTAIAPPDGRFRLSGTRWQTTSVCLAQGESRSGIDASGFTGLAHPGVVARVSSNDFPVVDGVTADLYAADGAGNRAEYRTSARPDPDGALVLPLEPGCWVVTYIAPAGRTWDTTGTPWLNRSVCVTGTETVDLGTLPLAPTPLTATFSIAVYRLGEQVGGVPVDAYAVDGDGVRTFLGGTVTSSTDRTTYTTPPSAARCWVLVLTAPGSDVWELSGGPQLELPLCANGDETRLFGDMGLIP